MTIRLIHGIDNIPSLLQILQQQITQFITHIDSASGLHNHSPHSGWTALQHLEHLSITGRSTPLLIEQAFSENTPAAMNDKGKLLFKLAKFPRGKTPSPDFSQPKGAAAKKIKNSFLRLAKQLEELSSEQDRILVCSTGSLHPFLGYLSPLDWLQFLYLHQKHHSEILDEIIS